MSRATNITSKQWQIDPSAGSPTETLLRLLQFLNNFSLQLFSLLSADASKGFPSYLLNYPISCSDGRCVQRAGTQSIQTNDLYLQGIPRSRLIVTKVYPKHNIYNNAFYAKFKRKTHIIYIIVARVQPKTSKGITDLLLLYLSSYWIYEILLRTHELTYVNKEVKISFVNGINQTNHSTN